MLYMGYEQEATDLYKRAVAIRQVCVRVWRGGGEEATDLYKRAVAMRQVFVCAGGGERSCS